MILKTLRGSKTTALSKKPIDWFYWKNMQSVDLWQASSLACGIDPLDESKLEQRTKIYNLIYSNAGNRAFFSMLYNNGYQCFLLSEVATWCQSIGFQIPDELAVLVCTHNKQLTNAPLTDIEPTENETTTAPPAKQSTIVDIDEKPLSERSEAGYLLTIGAMLKVFADSRINQTYMVDEILKKYPDIHGLSKRSLDDKFSKSNNVFNEKLKDSKQCTQKN